MNVHLIAVGRLRAGPERELVDDYLSRFAKSGRQHGVGAIRVSEIDERKARTRDSQGEAMRAVIPSGGLVCALDERGRQWTSPQFAQRLSGWLESGRPSLSFLIGGADGLEAGLRDTADARMSLGAMVWPHMLARAMLAEQLYRAVTILAGTPYHRA